ncbi:MAG: response regulator [Myxococcota bacterium]|nr:response regulator [Myxococcota bacterium]
MKRVLIVEDDLDLAEALQDALADRYDVQVAHDGREALDMLEVLGFDVVVIDLVMPVLDGESTLKQMRARGLSVPAIISSGTPDLAEIAVRIEAAAVLAKPYDIDELVACIEGAMRAGGGGGSSGPASPGGRRVRVPLTGDPGRGPRSSASDRAGRTYPPRRSCARAAG